MPLFKFMREQMQADDTEMFKHYNNGAGFAIYAAAHLVDDVLSTVPGSFETGQVERGPKQVIIEPKKIIFEGHTLGVR